MMTALQSARVEKDVENAYREALRKERPGALITSPHGTDGFAQWTHVRLLLEAKFDKDLKARVPLCNVLAQCLYYIKRFEASGEATPNVILVGDKNECFVLSTSSVQGFLDLPLDWTTAPSGRNPELTQALVEGFNILPYVYDVDGDFQFKEVIDKIETLAQGHQHAVKATLSNIGAIFLLWQSRVFKGTDLTPVEQVDVFLRCLFQPAEVYLHPTRNLLIVPGTCPEGVPVHVDPYKSFFDQFVQGYRPSEIEAFYACKDRLVEDDARRRQGAFFTPTLWVDQAHKAIDEALGPHWREECIVYDPAAGTGNLTRDYTFADLILSTAEAPDVQVIKDQGYNPGASIFQYDFLNPDTSSPFVEGRKNEIPDAAHKRLKDAAKAGKRLVILMNPPYGTANNAGTAKGDHKAGIAQTAVNLAMKRAKLGPPSQQLYAQFMYQSDNLARQYGFESHTIALFSMVKFMSSGSYRTFRHWWYDRYRFQSAFLFQASHFADVSGAWGICFTIWDGPGTTDKGGRLPCDLLDVEDFAVKQIGDKKAVYNSDGREASKWVRAPLRKRKGADAPQMSSGLAIKEAGRGSIAPGALYFFGNNANNLQDSSALVYKVSSADTRNNGLSVTPANWRRSIALYGARKLVKDHWTIHEDEYLAPTPSPAYEQWVDDCHVYALLDTKNNCTAMRKVPYKDGPPGAKTWTIHNHFFWMAHKDAQALLDHKDTPNLYRDCKHNPSKDIFGNPVESTPDPYMAQCLPTLNLSPEAQAVLDKLNALWIESLPKREAYAADKPHLHLTAWDAGSYQLKHIWRDLYPDDWKALQAAFKTLADKLQPGVYEHGFLLK